jgi:hypothetical protein
MVSGCSDVEEVNIIIPRSFLKQVCDGSEDGKKAGSQLNKSKHMGTEGIGTEEREKLNTREVY